MPGPSRFAESPLSLGPPPQLRRRFLRDCSRLLCGAALGGIAGCGTLLYPERRGQKGGRIDWKVVAMDGAGLLLFFIPGVIAFAVDIIEGTIYLPPEHYGSTQPEPSTSPALTQSDFHRIPIARQDLTLNGIAAAVQSELGQPIALKAGEYQTHRLPSLQHFQSAVEKLAHPTSTS